MTGEEGKQLVNRVVEAIGRIGQIPGVDMVDLQVILGGIEDLYCDQGALESRLGISRKLYQALMERLVSLAPPPSNAKTYAEKLNDPRWIAKRDRIRERDGNKCVQCGEGGEIHIHHSHYRAGREPWEYRDSDLFTLCKKHHETNHGIELEAGK